MTTSRICAFNSPLEVDQNKGNDYIYLKRDLFYLVFFVVSGSGFSFDSFIKSSIYVVSITCFASSQDIKSLLLVAL